jgi:glycolate oxidase
MEAAAAVVGKVFAAGYLPCALEVTDAFTLEAARKHLGAGLVPDGQAHVLLEVDGQPGSVRSEIAALGKLMSEAGAVSVQIAKTETACEKLWDLRRGFSMSLKATGLTKFNEDVTVPRGRVVDLFKFGTTLQKKYGIQVACFGHAGDGNIHVNLMADLTQKGMQAKVDQALDALFRQVIDWKGSITGEHGIGLAKMPWWTEAASPSLRGLHQRIKKALDPDGLLNPAKFLG